MNKKEKLLEEAEYICKEAFRETIKRPQMIRFIKLIEKEKKALEEYYEFKNHQIS